MDNPEPSKAGDKSLPQILDMMEANHANYSSATSARYVPALVKAVRRAVEIAKASTLPFSETVEIATERAANIEKQLTAILSDVDGTRGAALLSQTPSVPAQREQGGREELCVHCDQTAKYHHHNAGHTFTPSLPLEPESEKKEI